MPQRSRAADDAKPPAGDFEANKRTLRAAPASAPAPGVIPHHTNPCGGTLFRMSSGVETTTRTPSLRPVAHNWWWITGGLVLQLVGIGTPLAYVYTKAKHESIGGLLTIATVRLAWHESLHAKAGIAILAAGAVLFAIGSILLARPFAKSRLALLLAVPLAAVCGALVLGVAAVIVTLLILLFWNSNGDLGDFGGSSSTKKKRSQPQAQP